MIVDGHLHVFRPATADYPRPVDDLAPAGREAPVEDLLRVMDGAGVDRAVLVPLGPQDRYVAECRSAHPDRFAAIGVADDALLGGVPGTNPVDALDRRVAAGGLSGFRVNHLGTPGRPVTSAPLWPVLQRMAATGLVLWCYVPPAQLPLLDDALRALPGLRVVLNHLGFCPPAGASGTSWDLVVDAHGRPRIPAGIPPPTLPDVLRLARHPGVHVHFSGQYAVSRTEFPYTDLDPLAHALYDAYGAGRMLWASDYPWTRDVPGYDRLPELVDRQLPWLTGAERADVLGGSAGRLFTDVWGDA